jgi:hypothetical protein
MVAVRAALIVILTATYVSLKDSQTEMEEKARQLE